MRHTARSARPHSCATLLASLGQPKANTKAAASSKPLHKFYIDYTVPANDNVFDPAGFEKFLHDRIKVDGKTGQLGDNVKIAREGEFASSPSDQARREEA